MRPIILAGSFKRLFTLGSAQTTTARGSSGTGPGSAVAPALTGSEVNILNYGAVLNGVADDSAAVRAAIAAAGSGGTVLHPGGVAGIGTHVVIPSGVTIAGAAQGSSTFKALAALANNSMFDVNGTDGGPVTDSVTIRDLTFDMNSVSTSFVLSYRNTTNLTLDRCTFTNGAYYYVHETSSYLDGLTPLADEIMVRDCTFQNHTGTTRECLIAAYCTNFTVLRCRFSNVNLAFSVYRAATTTLLQDTDFNTVTGTNPNAVRYGRGCDNFTITNCSFTSCGSLAQATVYGVTPGSDYTLNGGDAIALLPSYIQNLSITHCTFTGCGVAYEVGAVVGFRDSGNIVQASLGTGVRVDNGQTDATFLGYASRDLRWDNTTFSSNMKTGGAAALLFAATVALTNLQATVKRCLFDDTAATQTRAVCFQGDNVPADSIFSGAVVDRSNTFLHPTTPVSLINSATGIAVRAGESDTIVLPANYGRILRYPAHWTYP